jgi:hypothetical protein
MEQIKKTLDAARKNSCSILPGRSQPPEAWQIEIREKYGDVENFLLLFAPDKQAVYAGAELRCFSGTAPSIRRVSVTYGDAVAESWAECQIEDLALFSGCRDKMGVKQIEETAKTILLNYGHLKVTELMVFFQRFKAGHYGKFYGVVDGLVITSALHDFLAYRSAKLDEARREAEKERLQKAQEANKEGITLAEYLAKKKTTNVNTIVNGKSGFFTIFL